MLHLQSIKALKLNLIQFNIWFTQYNSQPKMRVKWPLVTTQEHTILLVLGTTLYDKVCQWLAEGLWFYLGTLVSSTDKTDCHNVTEILLKVTLNTITLPSPLCKRTLESNCSNIRKLTIPLFDHLEVPDTRTYSVELSVKFVPLLLHSLLPIVLTWYSSIWTHNCKYILTLW